METLSIGICSGKSGDGKTTLAENLIRRIKQKFKNIPLIGIKFTKTSLYSSIIIDPVDHDHKSKDTDRMKKAGADMVIWVKATEADLSEITRNLKAKINDLYATNQKKIVLVEGNSLVRTMETDVIIFIDKNNANNKPSAKEVLERADIVIKWEYETEEIMEQIEKIEMRKKIEEALKERSNNGKIACAEARKIAEELKIPYIEVGRLANELKIKIRKCELGCF